jgi:hypothetical protein
METVRAAVLVSAPVVESDRSVSIPVVAGGSPLPRQSKKSAAAAALGKLGGSANSAAQNAARRKNAKKAGRPGRVCKSCEKPVQGTDLAAHDDCGLWSWQSPAERRGEAR